MFQILPLRKISLQLFIILFLVFCFSQTHAQCPHTLPFTEDFATSPLGACSGTHGGWTSTTVASGAGWWIPNTNYAGGTAPEAEAYGDQANGGVSETISLKSPSLNTTSIGSVTLSFKQNLYTTNSGASGSGTITVKVETSPDNTNWTQQYSAGFSATPSLQQVLHETRTLTVNGLSANTLWVRFSVSGVLFKVWGWEIDDVSITGTVAPTPTLASFSPANGCSGAGTIVTIDGTNFNGASAVNFNGTSASFSIVSNTQITAVLPAGATSGVITVITAGGTATSSISFTVNPTPTATATPSVQSVCSGDNVSIVLSSNVGGTSYSWTRTNPAGISGTMPSSGTTDPNGTLTSTNTGSTIVSFSIIPTAGNCVGNVLGSNVVVQPVPATPGTIIGLTSVCDGSLNTYSIGAVSGATSYTWTLPNGWSGTSSGASIDATAGSGGGTISVIANNSCGSSSSQILSVNIAAGPPTPGAISGTDTICSGGTTTYSIQSIAGATSYTWSLPNGWSGTSTTESINVTAAGAGGTISVVVNSNCGSSTAQTLNVSIYSGAPSLGAVSGSTQLCNGNTTTYSVIDIGASSYTWTLPNGWSGSSTSSSISATAGATGGNISVVANTSCGNSLPQTLTITIGAAPATPGSISGLTAICGGSTNTYSIAAVNGATSYTWILPNGWSGTSSTETIDAIAGSNDGDIGVIADNACGSSSPQTLSITIANIPATPASINGQASICDGSTNAYSVVAVNGATGYTWTLPNGWIGSSVTETINATSGSSGGSVSVSANNSCGSSTSQTLGVTVNPLPIVSFNFVQNPVCQNALPVTLSGLPASGNFSGSGVTGSAFNPSTLSAGDYVITYAYTDGNGCNASDTSSITVTVCSGINTVDDNSTEVYPNPFSNELLINMNTAVEMATLVLNDVTGKEVNRFELNTTSATYQINTSTLEKGVYLLNININGKTIAVKKLVRME